MRSILPVLLLAAGLVTANAAAPAKPAVVRPAADFTFPGISKSQSLRGVRGQPVVLLIAPSPKYGAFKTQVKNIREIYQQFANKQVIFAAAFTGETGPVKSDVPFVVVNNGPAVASAYGVQDKFNIAIIGKDGNLDYQTKQVLTSARVRDVIQNSYAVQANTGR
ncbi:MAG TPA: hypothetical protein VK961_19715 [Chthoniobacter sp.]|nr:hypothetical protein [Chthoniobacter sp.]